MVPVMVVLVVMAVLRHINALIPAFLDEIDGRAAGAVAMTVLVPVLHMAGRRMQIHGRGAVGGGMGVHGLAVDKLRCGITTQINAAVEAGLADTDGHVLGMAAVGEKGKHERCQAGVQLFHRARKSRCGRHTGLG